MRPRKGSVFARRFVLEKYVGEGPGTRVWRSMDQASGEPRAVKFLLPQIVDDPDRVVRALWDLIAGTQRIDHPAAVLADGAVAADGQVAIVTPWIEGSTLGEKRRRQRRRKFDYESIRGLIGTWMEAMQAVEKNRLFHGALKPSNLMLDDYGELRITDFGTGAWIAAELSRLKRYGRLESSLPYWSPAQMAAGGGSFWRDDIFSFGAIIYEFLTGTAPFPKRKPGSKTQVIAVPAPMISRRNRNIIPSELEQVIMVCLESNPTYRPSSFRRIRDHLRPSAPAPAQARQEHKMVEPATASAAGSRPAVPISTPYPSEIHRDGNPANGHSAVSSPPIARSRLDTGSASTEVSERRPKKRYEPAVGDKPSWYESTTSQSLGEMPSHGMGWLLKTFLVVVALGLVAVAGAFAWIVSGRELVLPWGL